MIDPVDHLEVNHQGVNRLEDLLVVVDQIQRVGIVEVHLLNEHQEGEVQVDQEVLLPQDVPQEKIQGRLSDRIPDKSPLIEVVVVPQVVIHN